MAGSGDAFERALRRELPRGVKGAEDRVPRTMWAEPAELGAGWGYQDGKGLFLGYRAGRRIGWADDRHAITIAGTRAGKGVSLVIPNLLSFHGSVLCIDPKGELARATARRRLELGKAVDQAAKVVVVDPFEENGLHPTGCYNPLSELDPTSREVIDQAGAIAEALVIYSGQGDPHWTSAARGVLRALILLMFGFDQKHQNLVAVRDFLMLTHPTLIANADAKKLAPDKALIDYMIGCGDAFERVVMGQGQALKSMSDKERESVLSETRVQTMFLDSPALRAVLTKSDFSLSDLARRPTSVFLCLPARHMDTHGRWLRVIVNMAVSALEPRRGAAAKKEEGKMPVLMLLEEFPVLQHMEKIQAAAGQLAGSGVKLWFVVQNLGQLKHYYKDAWETFIANAGVVTAFGNADVETLEYLVKKLGKVGMEVSRRSGASSSALLAGARPEQEELRDAALLEPDELSLFFAREKGRLLVVAAGQAPVVLERAVYHRTGEGFEGMYDE